jgi:xanthine dehydrogenase accessory factor
MTAANDVTMIAEHHAPYDDEDQAALRCVANQPGSTLCTLVGLDGSFSRRLGAQFAVAADGTTAGSLSDHCLEQELITRAREARSAGQPILLRYGQGSPFIDFRLPCGSGIDILIDPAPDQGAINAAVTQLDARQPATLALPIPETAPENAKNLMVLRHYCPALQLVILGTGAEARELSALANSFGLRVNMAGPDQGLSLGRAPQTITPDLWTAIILLFHDHEWEDALLTWALSTTAFYIGSLGGQKTRDERKQTLIAQGQPDAQIRRIRSPIGLIPRARDPRTLALSVLAEIIADYEQLRA